MKKQELDHVLRAAGRITGERQFIIIGSQSLHGKYPDLADDIVKSAEVDLLAAKRPGRTEWLNAIGVYSRFHESFGYYADPVDAKTATLPKGWKGRLVNLPPGDTEGVKGLCLEPHDLAIASTSRLGRRIWCSPVNWSGVGSFPKSDCFPCSTRLRSMSMCAIESATKSRQTS